MIEALYYTNKAPQVLMPRWMCQSYIKLLAIANIHVHVHTDIIMFLILLKCRLFCNHRETQRVGNDRL